jgi:hypothetical protein
VGQRVLVNGFLAKSEVSELDVAFGVQEDVLGFEVSVDNALTVQVLQCQRNLGNVKTSLKIKIITWSKIYNSIRTVYTRVKPDVFWTIFF